MITDQELREAIAECEGDRHPNASTCIKLASFYTIRDHLYGERSDQTPPPVIPSYSFASAPEMTEPSTVGDYGDSEFLQAVKGKDPAAVWAVIDELMDTMKIVNERVYNATMRKIGG